MRDPKAAGRLLVLALAPSMTGFTEAKLADNALWSPSLWFSMISIWPRAAGL